MVKYEIIETKKLVWENNIEETHVCAHNDVRKQMAINFNLKIPLRVSLWNILTIIKHRIHSGLFRLLLMLNPW